jgi:glycosyltransferase involved in cell wall biosynthesis
MNSKVSALILAGIEEENIVRTLSAISSIQHIVLIVSSNTDGTVQSAQEARPDVRVVQRDFDTHTQQWNFGLDQISTDWVLALDADYELSQQVQTEIARLEPPSDVIGYSAEFIYRIFGRSLRASSYPPRVVLFRTKRARYVDDGHTQTLWFYAASPTAAGKLELRPPSEIRGIGKLSGKIYHDDHKPLSHWIQSQDRYAKLEAKHLLAKPVAELNFQDRLRRKIFFAAPVMFLYLLFARGLIFDGWPGWFYVAQRTIAELLLSMRLLVETHGLENKK